ncbi:MAG: carboxypeptidase regulatory-like domain-containing protein [Myxococcaceae bacterium]|nr:carboxypeptidase regulatory-like domain-containing protein [Myxococcaceae bacterium]
MPNKRWLAIALLMLAAGLGALALFDTAAPAVPVPAFTFADAGPLRLTRAPSSFTVQGAPVPTALVTPTTSGACITGAVVDAVTGAGLAGATVTFSTFAGAVSTTTGRDGRFELKTRADGVISVAEVAAPNHFPFRPTWGQSRLQLSLVEGVCITGLTLSLVPRLEYEGEVVDPGDEPVEGARVTVSTEHEPPGAALVTNSDGRFRFHAVDGALVVATHPRFASAFAVVDFRVSATKQLTLRLGRRDPDAGPTSVMLDGLVLDEADAGVPGALVRVHRTLSSGEGSFERLEASLETDARGAFHLELESPGPWRVQASTAARVSPPLDTLGGPVVLRLDRGASLEGTVRDDEGHAVASFSLLLQRQLGALQLDALEPHHVVDPRGHFHLAGLAPGRYQVSAIAPGLAPAPPVSVDLVAGGDETVDLRLGVGASLSGSVLDRDSRSPLQGARLSLEQTRDEPVAALAVARTDERGAFTLQGLPQGRHSLFIAAASHHARLVSVELKPGANGPLTIDLGTVPDGGTPQLELVGIGAVLKASGDALVIERTVEGGGAAEAGLVPGDLVLSIDGTPTATLGFAGAIERIRGAEDTTVTLEVRRQSSAVESVTVRRRRISR